MRSHAFRLVGMVHLPPLPTAGNYTGQPVGEIAEAAACDAQVLAEAGFTDVMIQDANDKPQRELVDSGTIAAMARIGTEVAAAADIGVGVTLGHNDGPGAMAVAAAIGAAFIRVKVLTGAAIGPTGLLEGCAVATTEMRRHMDADVEIWADVRETTSRTFTGDLEWAANEAVKFGAADGLIVTRDSGIDDALDDIRLLRSNMPQTRFVVGGRVTVESGAAARGASDGAIIGGALKSGTGIDARIDPDRALAIAQAMERM